ncbi:unnamed protein product, partial [Meganyctiphanes norvegica]
GEITDPQLKNAMEGVIIKWVHQIDEVLRQDAGHMHQGDNFPKPLEELTFWTTRKENLTHLATQLNDKKVLMMSNILEITESAYFPAFTKMCADVKLAYHEACDIMVHITPLKPLLEILQECEYTEIPQYIPPLLHCICILWADCPAYRKPDRIVVLFKEISNLLIEL